MTKHMIIVDKHGHRYILNATVHRSGIVGQKKNFLLTVNRRGKNIEIHRIFQKGEFDRYTSEKHPELNKEIDSRPLNPAQVQKGCIIQFVDTAPMNYARDGTTSPIIVDKVLKESGVNSVSKKVLMLKDGTLVGAEDIMRVYDEAA